VSFTFRCALIFVDTCCTHFTFRSHFNFSSCTVTSFKKAVSEVLGRFYADSSHVFGRPSVSRCQTIQGWIHPDVMETRPDAFHGSRRFQLSFVDTEWEDSMNPSGRSGNIVQTPRSLIRKLGAYSLHQSKTSRQNRLDSIFLCQLCVDKVQPSGR